MDPNTNLQRQRQLCASLLDGDVGDTADLAVELAELARALDEWISRGGFLPQAWHR